MGLVLRADPGWLKRGGPQTKRYSSSEVAGGEVEHASFETHVNIGSNAVL